jgi:hypothetical protein
MKENMHRLSFSRAETVLLNSWTSSQQIVYHILRYFVKTAGLIELSVDESVHSTHGVLCNYHVKTLMLWACERHSEQWWSTSLVNTTARLLRVLGKWLESCVCQQYFVTECNLFDYMRS